MGGAGEVHERAGELPVGHHDDVETAVAPPGPGQTAHAHVLLLLAVLLVAHQVVGQEAWTGESRRVISHEGI